MIKKILYFVLSVYCVLWFFVFATGGGTPNENNKSDIEQSIRYYHEIRDDLYLMSNYVKNYNSANDSYPTEKDLIEWIESQSQISDYVKNFHLTMHLEDFPNYIVDEFGEPTSDSFSITLWTGDQHLYYASWVNGNSADVSIDDFGIPRLYSFPHFIISLFLIVFIRFYSIKRIKNRN